MYFLLKMVVIHCYVSLPEGTPFLSQTPRHKSTNHPPFFFRLQKGALSWCKCQHLPVQRCKTVELVGQLDLRHSGFRSWHSEPNPGEQIQVHEKPKVDHPPNKTLVKNAHHNKTKSSPKFPPPPRKKKNINHPHKIKKKTCTKVLGSPDTSVSPGPGSTPGSIHLPYAIHWW